MKPDRTASYIGIAMKAGRVSSGEFAVEKAVKDGKARLVIIAGDASANTKKKFKDMCSFYSVPAAELGDKEELGHMIGREMRACISINDEGLAEAVSKSIPD